MKFSLTIFWVAVLATTAYAQPFSPVIRLNQVGFYPQSPKIAVVCEEAPETVFYLKKAGSGKIVYQGKLAAPRVHHFSQKNTRIADFSEFKTSGTYVLELPSLGQSYPFDIKKKVHETVAKGALKGFYFQRVSVDLPERYAGKWHRPAGHPDNQVLVHASAASGAMPAGTVIASPGGWYDAGDYNKYIVNSGITMGTLMSLYEDFPAFCKGLKTDIPESKNVLPDLLDEVLWNLRWMLTMQDADDGGVYHKLTNAAFDAMNEMPHQAVKPRYVVQKSTTATLDFAAVTAQASRIFREFGTQLPGLADSCLQASEAAWTWAKLNPNVQYDQTKLNAQYDPDVNTGAYGDQDVADEWLWAAAELYLTTKNHAYYEAVAFFKKASLSVPDWSNVEALAGYSVLRHQKSLEAPYTSDVAKFRERLLQLADFLIQDVEKHAYHTVMGKTAKDFVWGSSAHAANQGILLVQAYLLTKDRKYLHHALGNLDYLLGRNATGYSFVTGFGDKTPMHPHHRPSVADGIPEPVPGLLSGGPNPSQQDKCTSYPSRIPDESFTDDDCSYASNEIAINWNAPLVYLAVAIEVLMREP
ncbi:MAG: glycoside hydrolase family 9 protein [Saprospiraceae bacterium]|nr:glycoside hydrolase family 9 protein [Saprospiraceae bacterium]